MTRKIRLYSRYTQWGIQGRGPGARVPPFFLDQTEARRVGKKFFETGPPPYLRVWMTAAPASQYIHHCYWIAFRAHMKENLPGGLLRFIFAGYVPLASQNPYPIIVYFVANYRLHLSHFGKKSNFRNLIFATFCLCNYLIKPFNLVILK